MRTEEKKYVESFDEKEFLVVFLKYKKSKFNVQI